MDFVQIGKRIKWTRKRVGITQKELANKIGRTESSVQKYENGKVEIPISVLEDIAKELGVSADEFLIGFYNEKREIYLKTLG
ncbi:MAG: helix-turn-helix domain-containing protein, partial [Lactococcus lactis]